MSFILLIIFKFIVAIILQKLKPISLFFYIFYTAVYTSYIFKIST